MIKREHSSYFWSLSLNNILVALGATLKGLPQEEAQKRLLIFGENKSTKIKRTSGYILFFQQFNSPLILLLVISIIFALILSEQLEALIIALILIINGVFSFVQEYKANRALESLSQYVSSKSKVVRNGAIFEIDSINLVPGDVILLVVGDVVSADARLIDIKNFTVDESLLTGESLPVEKNLNDNINSIINPADAKNIIFAGTTVSSGVAHALVVATGTNTYIGEIAIDLKKRPMSSFHQDIVRLGYFLMKVTIAVSIFVFIINSYMGKGILESALFVLAISVSMAPELLPFIITANLSKSALLMARHSVIVKKLVSIEMLGNMDILCTDKTGTLTEGVLSLNKFLAVDGKPDLNLILYACLCRENIYLDNIENPIDKAVVEYVKSNNLEKDLRGFKLIDFNSFDFLRRRLSVLVNFDNKNIYIAKGAPDSILSICSKYYSNGQELDMSNHSDQLQSQASSYENDGYRVIAVAYKNTENKSIDFSEENNFVFFGYLLLIDFAKKGVKQVLEKIGNLGVVIKLISGDSPVVTKKICHEVGLHLVEDRVISGQELDNLLPQDFVAVILKYNAFARVHPEQKRHIIEILKNEKHVVGYLGDGINDVPALQYCDVGISVDSAVEVAKNSADIILLKKSLKVLSEGIILGRKSFANITKYILNNVSTNFGNIITIALASIFLDFIPVLPSQVLLNNLLSDMTLVSLYTDNVDPEFVVRPRNWNMQFIGKFMTFFGILSVLFDMMFMFLTLQVFKFPVPLFRTGLFLESFYFEILVNFSIRTKRIFYKSMPSWQLLASSISVLVFALLLTVSKIGNMLFEFVPMPPIGYIIIVLLTAAYIASVEYFKRFFFKNF